MKRNRISAALAAAALLASSVLVVGPANGASATRTQTCPTTAVVTAETATPNSALHTHKYVATSGATITRQGSGISFRSGSGYYKATVTMKTNTVESFSKVSTSCFHIG